jgi:hypothetical protein
LGIVNACCQSHHDFHSPRDPPTIAASCLAASDIDHPADGHRTGATLGKAQVQQIDAARGAPIMSSIVRASTAEPSSRRRWSAADELGSRPTPSVARLVHDGLPDRVRERTRLAKGDHAPAPQA